MSMAEKIADLFEERLRRIEADIAAAEGDGLRARWEFGKEVLARKTGKKLSEGVLDEVIGAVGISRRELQYRVAFAEKFPDENRLCNAIAQWPSWYQLTQEGLVKRGQQKRSRNLVAASLAKRDQSRRKVFAKIDKLADGEFHTGREWAATFSPNQSTGLSFIPWLTIEWNNENRVKLSIDSELRAICEGRTKRPDLSGMSVFDFLTNLRAEVIRRRKENHDERMKRIWNPEAISMRTQTELLNWIEEQLDLVPKE